VPAVEEVIARVSLWRGVDVVVSPLSGGLTNDNYLVEAGGTKYVVRIPGPSTELLAVDRSNEVHNTRAAAEAGIGPRVLEHLPDVDVMVLEFIQGRTMSGEALRSPDMAARMASSLRQLHAGPRFLLDFDMFRLVEYYLRIVDTHGLRIPDGYVVRMPAVADVERALAIHALPSVP
jgi:aminoglycoside phosphotransferase (APT) family kinase protein